MPFARKRPPLTLTPKDQEALTTLSQARTELFKRVERVRMILAYAGGESISSIARQLATNRPKVERCIDEPKLCSTRLASAAVARWSEDVPQFSARAPFLGWPGRKAASYEDQIGRHAELLIPLRFQDGTNPGPVSELSSC